MRELRTEIQISAPIDKVWQQLQILTIGRTGTRQSIELAETHQWVPN